MTDLKEYNIEDIAEIHNDKRIPLSKMQREDRQGEFPYYGASGIIDFVDDYLFDGDYILISEDGENLKSRQTPIAFKASGKFWVNNHAHIIKGKSLFYNDLIIYYFKNLDLNPYITGAVQPKLNKSNLLSIPIFLPKDISEQKAIAEVLSGFDDKIDLLHRQNKTLEQMAETLFRQWFIEEAKEDWEWCTLNDFIEVQRGLSYKGAGLTNSDNGIPMHNLNSVYEGGGYKVAGIKYYSGDYQERHRVYEGDVIVTNTEQGHEHLLIGFPAIVPASFGEVGIFSQHIYRLEIKSTVTNFFLYHLLKTQYVHEQVAGATNGSTVNMLPKDGIEWVKFRCPQTSLIQKFTIIAEDIYNKQQLNQTQIRKLEGMRDSLLPKLMSGEVRVV